MRQYSVKNGKVEIVDIIESELDSSSIERQLNSIMKEKTRLLDQNKMIVERYRGLQAEETTLKSLLADIGNVTPELIIDKTIVRDTGETDV